MKKYHVCYKVTHSLCTRVDDDIFAVTYEYTEIKIYRVFDTKEARANLRDWALAVYRSFTTKHSAYRYAKQLARADAQKRQMESYTGIYE